ncbi:MAG: hypothetical protein GX437_03175 [Sphingobacteriales bacterium]|nr:hypothetical protein [Sphingobacteriales bacterium]
MADFKKIWLDIKFLIRNYFFPMLFVAAFFFFASFASRSVSKILCSNLIINIENEDELRFLDKNDILAMLTEKNGRAFKNQPISETNFYLLEKFLKNNSLVDNVDIYNDLKGNIFVDLSFRKPIIRIMSVYNENYYIDEKGKKMGISPKFSPKVPVATGHTYSTSTYPDYDKKLFELATFISNDKFLSSLTGQIYVDFNKEITIIPRIGNFEILLGKIENLDKKFRKLKIFYEKIIPAEGWKNYKKVDLRFEKQIVVN